MMEILNKICAGLDIHKKKILACIRKLTENGEIITEIKTFGTMTIELRELKEWLLKNGITHVAMEATGVYWKPIWNVLEGYFNLLLANPQHIKKVPGRKTDVKDCEWIAQLLQYGLLKNSYIPDKKQRQLRDLTRQRSKLEQQKSSAANRIQKVLEDANIKLASVANDILGASGRTMLKAIINGEKDAEKLANMSLGRLREKIPDLKNALEGNIEEHHIFMLQALMEQIESLEKMINKYEKRIEEITRPFESAIALLDTIPGINKITAQGTISEIGITMEQFPTEKNISSWAGTCPGNDESAGKRKNCKTPKGNRSLHQLLSEAAWAASRSKNTYLRALYLRLAPRKGKKKAIAALKHTLLIIIYNVLKKKVPYHELGADYFLKLNKNGLKRYHVKKLEKLGFKVTLDPCENAA